MVKNSRPLISEGGGYTYIYICVYIYNRNIYIHMCTLDCSRGRRPQTDSERFVSVELAHMMSV